MSSPNPDSDSLPSTAVTSVTSADDEDQYDTNNADAEYAIDDESWSGDVHYAFVLHGVAVIPDHIIDGKPFLRLKFNLPLVKTLFKLKRYRYWPLNKTATLMKLRTALWTQHRASKHSKNIWLLGKEGAPVETVVTVNVDGVKLDVTSNVKNLFMRMSRASLTWLSDNLKADNESGAFFPIFPRR